MVRRRHEVTNRLIDRRTEGNSCVRRRENEKRKKNLERMGEDEA
jgi:hypothetical protein